jgi:hypothetical protein
MSRWRAGRWRWCRRVRVRASAITVVSTPASSSRTATVWRNAWAVMCFPFSDGHMRAAVAWWRVSLRSIASRLSERPVRVGNTGSVGVPEDSSGQEHIAWTAGLVNGVIRSLRPLPWQATCAPAPRWMSLRRSVISSETLLDRD